MYGTNIETVPGICRNLRKTTNATDFESPEKIKSRNCQEVTVNRTSKDVEKVHCIEDDQPTQSTKSSLKMQKMTPASW